LGLLARDTFLRGCTVDGSRHVLSANHVRQNVFCVCVSACDSRELCLTELLIEKPLAPSDADTGTWRSCLLFMLAGMARKEVGAIQAGILDAWPRARLTHRGKRAWERDDLFIL